MTWYDRNAHSQEFSPGYQVLVLLLTSTNQLLTEWQGPYPMMRQIGEVNYEVHMANRRKQKRNYHINMLCALQTQTAVACWAGKTSDPINEEDPLIYSDIRPDGEPLYGESFPSQVSDLQCLFDRFSTVFNSNPGCMTMVVMVSIAFIRDMLAPSAYHCSDFLTHTVIYYVKN